MYEQEIYDNIIKYALYIIDNKCTIRATAKRFGVAKSTVHYNLKYKLKLYDKNLYMQVKEIMKNNFDEKHIRGGMATRQKYLNEKQVNNYDNLNYL